MIRSRSHILRDQQGVAYIEFAICIPFLLALLMGAIEVTRYILVAQKVEKVAVTISDVVSQASTMSSAELARIITAAGQVMQPYEFNASGYVIISSVTKSGTNPPVVNWQYTCGGLWTSASRVGMTGGSATLPAGFTMYDRDNIIIAEVFYNFQPLLASNGAIGSTSIYKLGLFKPRLGDLTTLSALPHFWLPQKGAVL